MNMLRRLLRPNTLALAVSWLALFLALNEGAREAVASALQAALPPNSTILNFSTTKPALDIDDRGVGGDIFVVKRSKVKKVWVDTNGVLMVVAVATITPTVTPSPTLTPVPPTATP